MAEVRSTIQVVADDREVAGGVVAELRKFPEIGVTVRRLRCGDYQVGENFLVERKTLPDFAASVMDGRLFRQASAMTRESRRGVIILEGRPATARRMGLTRESLQGALITIGVFYGLAVLRSGGPAETARLLSYLGDQAGRFASGSLVRPGWRPRGKRARQLFLLQGLPGVGPGRAARLLDRFGTVGNVAAASLEELSSLDGIGAATAAKIRWSLSEPAAGYLP